MIEAGINVLACGLGIFMLFVFCGFLAVVGLHLHLLWTMWREDRQDETDD